MYTLIGGSSLEAIRKKLHLTVQCNSCVFPPNIQNMQKLNLVGLFPVAVLELLCAKSSSKIIVEIQIKKERMLNELSAGPFFFLFFFLYVCFRGYLT